VIINCLLNMFLGVVVCKPREDVIDETEVMGWQGNRSKFEFQLHKICCGRRRVRKCRPLVRVLHSCLILYKIARFNILACEFFILM
jgi:hypothetical protein